MPTEDRIRARAHQLWLDFPELKAETHWDIAENQLRQEDEAEFARLLQAFAETVCAASKPEEPTPEDWTRAAEIAFHRTDKSRAMEAHMLNGSKRLRTRAQMDAKNRRARERRKEARQ